MKRMLSAAILAVSAVVVSGCNTMKGFSQDVVAATSSSKAAQAATPVAAQKCVRGQKNCLEIITTGVAHNPKDAVHVDVAHPIESQAQRANRVQNVGPAFAKAWSQGSMTGVPHAYTLCVWKAPVIPAHTVAARQIGRDGNVVDIKVETVKDSTQVCRASAGANLGTPQAFRYSSQTGQASIQFHWAQLPAGAVLLNCPEGGKSVYPGHEKGLWITAGYLEHMRAKGWWWTQQAMSFAQ